MKVQIRPCRCSEDSSAIEQCATEDASFYGVYQGEPGNLMWTADFNCHSDAYNWANEVAENNACHLEDLCEF